MKILIVDDHPVNLSLLKKMLKVEGHQVVLAENGEQAVAQFQQNQPNLVLMDVMMPVMDGIEAIKLIRKFDVETWVQIIILSALGEEDNLIKGLDAGADDYITKPFNTKILRSKISAVQRMVSMQNDLFENKQKLLRYNQAAEEEQVFAKGIFEKLVGQNDLQDHQIDFWVRPSKKLSGDLVSMHRQSETQLYFMLADSTGHGLPAALPIILIHKIFQTMSEKNMPVQSIAREINSKIKQHLPVGHFVALNIGIIDQVKHTIELWNGGMPPPFVLNDQNKLIHSFSSKHVFCGILPDQSFDDTCETWQWHEKIELFVYSDGLTDAVNEHGNLLGDEGLSQILFQSHAGKRIQFVKEAISRHIDVNKEQDDISCLVIQCPITP